MCHTHSFLAAKLQNASLTTFTLSFQRNSSLLGWQLTGIICSSISMLVFVSNYLTACDYLTACSSQLPWGLYLWPNGCFRSGFKISTVMVTTFEYLCVWMLSMNMVDLSFRGWNEEQKQCFFSPYENLASNAMPGIFEEAWWIHLERLCFIVLMTAACPCYSGT